MRIEYLADHRGAIPTVARWHHDQWGAITTGVGLEDRIRLFEARARKDGVPAAFVALLGEEVAGVACLVASDLDSRQDLTPWLASVLVSPAHRGHGIGSALSDRVAGEAQRLRFPCIYLMTFDRERFYERLGWSVYDRALHFDRPVTIMVRRLTQGRS